MLVLLIFFVPELESCSRCGKQVLISRYTWSKKQVICKRCAEADIDSSSVVREKSQSQQDKFIGPSFNEVSTRETPEILLANKSLKSQQAILVTWPILLRIFVGILIFVFLILAGRKIIRDGTQNSPYQNAPSSIVN
mgnify:CR=1 FL=1